MVDTRQTQLCYILVCFCDHSPAPRIESMHTRSSRKFHFESRPAVQVTVKTHADECPYNAAVLLGETSHAKLNRLLTERCRCPKHVYVKQARYREALGTTNWEEAERKAKEWADAHDPEIIEKRAEKQSKAISRQPIPEAFDLFIQSKNKGDDGDPVLSKFRTMKKDFCEFLAKWNAGKPVPAQIGYVDQITTSLLEDHWRPTWFDGKGSYWSRTKRREQVRSFFKYCVDRQWISANPAKGMQIIKRNKKEISPTPPFSAKQYEALLDGCALYESSFRDRNGKQLVITNERLAAFIEVMRWCGARISDVSLMRRDAIGADGIWRYTALKNGAECQVPVPAEVLYRLEKLQLIPALDDDYYFWSGKSRPQNAADPWQRALARLWPLCDAIVNEVIDKRNKVKVQPSSHMFRNTFAVECRKAGLSYAEIGEAIGDDEQTVKEHYAAYCEEYDRQVAEKIRLTHRKMPKPSSSATLTHVPKPPQRAASRR